MISERATSEVVSLRTAEKKGTALTNSVNELCDAHTMQKCYWPISRALTTNCQQLKIIFHLFISLPEQNEALHLKDVSFFSQENGIFGEFTSVVVKNHKSLLYGLFASQVIC